MKILNILQITSCFVLMLFASCSDDEKTINKEEKVEPSFEVYEVFGTYKDSDAPYLNMRKEANSDAKIIKALYDGTQLNLLDKGYGEKGNWSKVEVVDSKEIGFVNNRWIRKVLYGHDRLQHYDLKALKLKSISCYEGNECTFQFTKNRKKYKFWSFVSYLKE